MKSNKKLILAFTLIFLSFSIFAQSVPRTYKGISLGLNVDETKELLVNTGTFGYTGDRDVSFLPGENRVLIETDARGNGSSRFLDRCYFQFDQDILYIMTFNINTDNMDYYSVFTTLCKKYGEPTSIDPSRAMWKDNQTTLYLEKPLTLKYIDNTIFDKTLQQSSVKPAVEEITREMFLDEL